MHRSRTAALATLLALGLGACSGAGEERSSDVATLTPDRPVIQPGRPGEANATLTGPVEVALDSGNEADARFMAEMIIHHSQALEMVELSRDGLADEQVKAIAGRIEAAQRPEVQVMAAWLVAHDYAVPREAVEVGVDVEAMGGQVAGAVEAESMEGHGGHGDMPGMASAADLDALASARGEAADLLFLELMTAHHEGALEMAGTHGAEGMDVRALELSTGIHTEQNVEIGRMADLAERLGQG